MKTEYWLAINGGEGTRDDGADGKLFVGFDEQTANYLADLIRRSSQVVVVLAVPHIE